MRPAVKICERKELLTVHATHGEITFGQSLVDLSYNGRET